MENTEEEVVKKSLTFDEVTTEARKIVAEMITRDTKSITNTIDSIVNDLNGGGVSGKVFSQFSIGELSIMQGRLAVLRSSLVEPRTEAALLLRKAELLRGVKCSSARAEVKESFEAELKTNKVKYTKEDVDTKLDRYLVKQDLVVAFLKVYHERLQSYRYSIPDTIKSIQYRVDSLV